MNTATTTAAILGLVLPVFAMPSEPFPVWYDQLYDEESTPLTSVACSNGQNGLITQGYNTFADLPTYPFVGGAPQIDGWDSFYCGTCWMVIYTSPSGEVSSHWFTAIDTPVSGGGYSISMAGLNYLTGGNALAVNGVTMVFAEDTSNM